MTRPAKAFTYSQDIAIDKDVKTLFDWVSKGDVVTTAPNGNKKGRVGDFVFYNNSGTFTLWVNKDGATSWQQI